MQTWDHKDTYKRDTMGIQYDTKGNKHVFVVSESEWRRHLIGDRGYLPGPRGDYRVTRGLLCVCRVYEYVCVSVCFTIPRLRL